MTRWLGMLVVGVGVATAGGAGTEPITLDGLTFSDGPAILIVRGMTHRFGNRIRSHHEVGFALTKLVRNGTSQPWSLFNLELREFFDRESPFGDGLSFGQASDAGRPFRSDGFIESLETREPFDGVQFFDGLIAPGEIVALTVVVTDTTPRWEFYLLQKRDSPLAGPTRPGAPAGTGPASVAHNLQAYRAAPARRPRHCDSRSGRSGVDGSTPVQSSQIAGWHATEYVPPDACVRTILHLL